MTWIEKAQAELRQEGFHHALVTQTGVSYSTANFRDMEQLLIEKDTAYSERNKMLVVVCRMALALGCKAGIGKHEGENGENDWRNIVFIDLPSGQVSWHIDDSDVVNFAFLSSYEGKWDGHTTEEKWNRVINAFVV